MLWILALSHQTAVFQTRILGHQVQTNRMLTTFDPSSTGWASTIKKSSHFLGHTPLDDATVSYRVFPLISIATSELTYSF
jgi:hypothetical protein